MLISICTPTHDVRHLRRAYESIVAQVGGVQWEWVLGLNGGVTSEEVRAALGNERLDPRVRMVDVKGPGVGRVKRATFEAAAGDVLLELDHDDTLECRALFEVAGAFEQHPEVGFVYSDCIDVSDTGGLCTYHDPQVRLSWEANGWTFYESCHDGEGTCVVPSTFEASPQSLSLIYWAPNHLRAWRRESYWAAGGHDANLQVLDDHDLLCRTFIDTAMLRIPRPLYRYHVHGQNTWLKETKEIAKKTPGIGRKYLRQMIVADVKRRGLPLIDLGGAHDCPEPWTSVDLPGQGAVIEADLSERWPFEDSSVGAFRASDFLEHMADAIHVMQEIHRCLVPGGWLISDTPSTDGRGAWQDPTHRCHSEDTELLTCEGFKLFSELTGDERIYALDVEKGIAEETTCEAVHAYPYNGYLINFLGRNLDCLVTPNHRMVVGSSDETTALRFADASWVLNSGSLRRIPSNATFDGDFPEYVEIPGSRHRLTSNPNVRFVGDSVRLASKPFFEFMGWYLSEGWTTSRCSKEDGGRGNHYRIGIAQSERANPKKYEEIGECLRRLGYEPYRTKLGWCFSDKHLCQWLAQLGHSHEKYIPVWMKQAHPELLALMLETLMLGDGSPQGTGGTYASTSHRLASDVQEIAIKCGWRVSMSKELRVGRPISINPDYRSKHDMNLVFLSRSRERYLNPRLARAVPYQGTVYCVTAGKHGVILTRRNGKVLWSGNSGWNENSWWYWTRKSHAKYLRSRGITEPLFVEAHVETYYPNPWCDQHEIPYVRADVWADKPGADRRFPRPPRA